MKLAVEIPDEVFRSHVQALVQRETATLTHELINTKLNEMLVTKLERVPLDTAVARVVGAAVDKAIEAELERALGPKGYNSRVDKVRSIIGDAALTLIKR